MRVVRKRRLLRRRDWRRGLLRRAIKQIVASFPVYRTYVDLSGAPSDADRRDIDWAFAQARRMDRDIHPSAFDFLRNALKAETETMPTQGVSRAGAVRLAMKLQQFSGPAMAKGVEDTAFYRYNRFVALNEVGGDQAADGLRSGRAYRLARPPKQFGRQADGVTGCRDDYIELIAGVPQRRPGPLTAPRLSSPLKFLVERRVFRRQRLLGAASGPVAVRVGAVVLVEPRLRRVEAFPAR